MSAVDDKPWAEVLASAVAGRLVDYAAVEKKRARLDAYCEAVGAAKLERASEAERLAFFINAYNALCMRAFLTHKKVSVLGVKGFFDAEKHFVAGGALTLNELEERHIRRLDPAGRAKDARIHFAVNCASFDCPPLRKAPYTRDVDRELEEQTRAFLARPEEVVVHADTKRIVVVQLFEWYASDFGGEDGVRAFLFRYRPDVAALKDSAYDLDFRPYDWRPNAKP